VTKPSLDVNKPSLSVTKTSLSDTLPLLSATKPSPALKNKEDVGYAFFKKKM